MNRSRSDPMHMNGWDYGPNDLSIIFYGAACDNLQKGVTTGIQRRLRLPAGRLGRFLQTW